MLPIATPPLVESFFYKWHDKKTLILLLQIIKMWIIHYSTSWGTFTFKNESPKSFVTLSISFSCVKSIYILLQTFRLHPSLVKDAPNITFSIHLPQMTLTTPTARNGALAAATAVDSLCLAETVTLNPATACWIIVNKQHFWRKSTDLSSSSENLIIVMEFI